jgi:RimJ/RimL family protein N-acetyltransferase
MEIGWVIASAYWNQGYATEAAAACRDNAFGALGRDRVISLIAAENVASIRVAEKIGERYERDVEIMVGPVGLYSLEKAPAR